MRASTLALLVAAVSAFPLAGYAIPTGLNAMPTAEMLPFGVSRLDYQLNNSGLRYAPARHAVVGTQTGLLPGVLEGGVDDVDGTGTVYNAKLRLLNETMVLPAVALGGQNIGGGEKVQWYAVGTKTLLGGGLGQGNMGLRVHAGVMREDRAWTKMLGANLRLGHIELKADHFFGGANPTQTSLGASLALGKFVATVASYDVTRDPKNLSFSVGYVYSTGEY